MACRVGITTNPIGRRRYWASRYRTLRNWRIVGRYSTKTAAQRRENQIARIRGCVAAPGGRGPQRATWYVYMFDYYGR